MKLNGLYNSGKKRILNITAALSCVNKIKLVATIKRVVLFYFSYLRSEDNSAVNPEEKTVHQVRGDLIYPIGIESGRIVRMDFDMNVCLNFSCA